VANDGSKRVQLGSAELTRLFSLAASNYDAMRLGTRMPTFAE
jgi:hypothetical protein